MNDKIEFPKIKLSDIKDARGIEQIHTDFIVAQNGEENIKRNLFDYPTQFEGGAFAFCLEGEAEATINLNTYIIKKGSMVVIPSNSIIQFHKNTAEFRTYMAAFSPRLFDGIQIRSAIPLMAEILENPVFNLSEEESQTVVRSCKFIYEKSQIPDNPHRKQIMQHLILSLFYEVSHIFQKQRSNMVLRQRTHNEKIMEEFARLVSKHYKKERNVQFYADTLCLTPKYLSTLIKKTSGRSVPEWLRTAVMIDAKVQLKYTTLTVQQISEDLNFPNPSFFGRFFKKHAGITPLEYRMK